MIDTGAIEHSIGIALSLLPVLLYFGLSFSLAMDICSLTEWLSFFIPDGLETVGDALLWLLLMVLHLMLTPGAVVFYLVRGILRINISHIRKDNENENCNSGR